MTEPTTIEPPGLAVHTGPRIVGTVIDGLVLAFCMKVFPFGLIAGPLYCVVGMRRRTLGQRVARTHVVTRDGTPLDLRRAALRSLPIVTLMAVGDTPVCGMFLAAVVALLWLASEAWLYLRGWRLGLGDLIAGTATVRQPPRDAPARPAAPA